MKFIKSGNKLIQRLQNFEDQLDPQNPELGPYHPRIIGFGEMSTVFTFGDPILANKAYKRMAIFRNIDEATQYEKDYIEYNKLLNHLKITTPEFGCSRIAAKNEEMVLYLNQALQNPKAIAHKLIHGLAKNDCLKIFEAVLESIQKVFTYNQNQIKSGLEIGLDAQLSNWGIADYKEGATKLPKKVKLIYIDTSTPLIRKDGKLQLDPELFLRVCPSSLVWMIRLFFLDDVVNRYFELRNVIIDVIANLYKENKPELIDDFITRANLFLNKNWPEVNPITKKEIISYYKEDARIWSLFLGLRRLERWIRTKVLRRSYALILPGKIKR